MSDFSKEKFTNGAGLDNAVKSVRNNSGHDLFLYSEHGYSGLRTTIASGASVRDMSLLLSWNASNNSFAGSFNWNGLASASLLNCFC
jgi:hypothetical protein